MLGYLLFVPQLLLLALYDWIFFANSYKAYPANSWWAFVLLHCTFIIEIVAICFIRRMRELPIIKKHPMWAFSVIFVLQYLFATVFALVRSIRLKWVIILLFSVIAVELAAFGILYLVQRRRDRKNAPESYEEIPEEIPQDDSDGTADEDTPEEETEPAPEKIKSSAMLLLMNFLADPADWDAPLNFARLDQLTELASSCTQHTYAELEEIESELKLQTNALKTYFANDSHDRALTTIEKLIDVLCEREDAIEAIESPAL